VSPRTFRTSLVYYAAR